MNRNGYYDTKGKQALLFGNATIGQIILITLLFLLNAAAILCIDNFLIHRIPRQEAEELNLVNYIPGDILDIHYIDTGLLALYETGTGEQKIAKATRNAMHRYRLALEVTTISDGLYIHDGLFLDYTVENSQITKASQITVIRPQNQTGIMIALSFLLTVLERQLFQKLREE